jgi:hypothetical protein
MTQMRVSREAVAQLVGDFSRQIEKAAGSSVAQEAGKILDDVTQSLFTQGPGATEGKLADRVPNALTHLSAKLKELGIDATTIGEVLNRLNQMLGKNRAMRPAKTLKRALKGGKLVADSAKLAELQAAIDSQAEAADLLQEREEAQEQAQEQAKKGRYGNF